jgi:hypothetical protein
MMANNVQEAENELRNAMPQDEIRGQMLRTARASETACVPAARQRSL